MGDMLVYDIVWVRCPPLLSQKGRLELSWERGFRDTQILWGGSAFRQIRGFRNSSAFS